MKKFGEAFCDCKLVVKGKRWDWGDTVYSRAVKERKDGMYCCVVVNTLTRCFLWC